MQEGHELGGPSVNPYGLEVRVPRIHVEILTSNVMIIESEGLVRCLDHKSRILMNRTSALIRDPRELSCSSSLLLLCVDTENGLLWARQLVLTRHWISQHLDPKFPSLQPRNKSLLSKSFSLWYFCYSGLEGWRQPVKPSILFEGSYYTKHSKYLINNGYSFFCTVYMHICSVQSDSLWPHGL